METENTVILPKKSSKDNVLMILGIIFIIIAISVTLITIFIPKKEHLAYNFPNIPSKIDSSKEKFYSKLTGLELANANQITAPTYCIQVPNGTDGARPQVGLNQAGIIFEAIAEVGITRFAAIFQNQNQAILGPIRSIRKYYLDWDVPFDCTIVHFGGEDVATEEVKSYPHLDGIYNSTHIYRGTKRRAPNNAFTTGDYLSQYNNKINKTSSNINGFSRLNPTVAETERFNKQAQSPLEITTAATEDTSALAAKVSHIKFTFSNNVNYAVVYDYDTATNAYKRSYANGNAHNVYVCPDENMNGKNPEDMCTLTQLAPTVVIAMIVKEKKASDGYHEDITSIGSGQAYVFQNGDIIKGTWEKTSREAQITFKDSANEEIKLVPGQTIISAVPEYGAVDY